MGMISALGKCDMGNESFKIKRIVEGPRDLVFKAWTDPQFIMQWWGPEGFTSPFCKVDFKVGGAVRYCMKAPDGNEYWNAAIFKEIVAPEKLVMSFFFIDKDGNFVEPEFYGLGEDVPVRMKDTITFRSLSPTSTELILEREIPEEIAKKYRMIEGWNSSLNKFEKVIKS